MLTMLSWILGLGLAAVYLFAIGVAAKRVKRETAKDLLARQELHWVQQTTHLAHPDTCPREIVAWLAEPLVPAGQVDTLDPLSFQRCALACGHDPAMTQWALLRKPQYRHKRQAND